MHINEFTICQSLQKKLNIFCVKVGKYIAVLLWGIVMVDNRLEAEVTCLGVMNGLLNILQM